MNNIKIHSYEEFRREILLSRPNKNYELEMCLNQVWYNLLSLNDSNWKSSWDLNLNPICQENIIAFFNKK